MKAIAPFVGERYTTPVLKVAPNLCPGLWPPEPRREHAFRRGLAGRRLVCFGAAYGVGGGVGIGDVEGAGESLEDLTLVG